MTVDPETLIQKFIYFNGEVRAPARFFRFLRQEEDKRKKLPLE